jgi:ribose/xylose/arabinose/galactoside ABC-type transport system permease subunit
MNEPVRTDQVEEPVAAARSRLPVHLSRLDFMRDLILLLAWLALMALFATLSPYFLMVQNFKNIGLAITIIGISAVGATIVLISGGIDLTVGSMIGLSVITVGALLTAGVPVVPAMVPVPIITMLVLYVIVWAIMKYTNFGHYVYAIGDNAGACRLAGVDVNKWRYVVYIVGAAFAAVAGMFLASLMQASLPQAGNGYELSIIAAVILGGTSLSGGVGSVFGTLLGVLIMGTLDNGFTLLNVPAFYQMIAKGAVLIFAVFIDQLRTGGYE